MKFIVDECSGPRVAQWLREQGYDVFSVYDELRGASDDQVLGIAYAETRILITNDKDFGEKIFREKRQHSGVILIRLVDERSVNKISAIQRLLSVYKNQLTGRFTVVTEKRVRITE